MPETLTTTLALPMWSLDTLEQMQAAQRDLFGDGFPHRAGCAITVAWFEDGREYVDFQITPGDGSILHGTLGDTMLYVNGVWQLLTPANMVERGYVVATQT